MSTSQLENQKTAILLLGSQMETGGAQHNLLSLAAWFHENGYPVTTAFLYDKEGLHDLWRARYDFPIIDLKSRRWGAPIARNILLLPGGLLRLFFLMISSRFVVIETFTHHANIIGIPLAWITRIPVRLAQHRGRFKTLSAWQETLHTWISNSKMTSWLLVNSRGSYQQAVEEGIHSDKIIVIPNGINLTEVSPEERLRIRNELNAHDTHLVLSVGRLRYEKGHTFLIQAAGKVLEQCPDTMFVLAGDGTLRRELEAETQRCGVSERVLFLGTRSDAQLLMAAADVFVLPSRTEGMPNALLEAMGMGASVVASWLGGTEEIIEHNVHGLLVPPEDVDALSSAIIDLLIDENRRRRLARAGQKHIHENFTLPVMCQRYVELINATMDKNNC